MKEIETRAKLTDPSSEMVLYTTAVTEGLGQSILQKAFAGELTNSEAGA